MKRVKEYQVVATNGTLENLEDKVNHMLKENWVPLGGVVSSSNPNVWLQAMMRDHLIEEEVKG